MIHRAFINVCDIGEKAKVEEVEMVVSLTIIKAAASKIPPQTVIMLIIASAIFVIGAFFLLGMFVRNTPNDKGNNDPLKYGNFFVVAIGIVAALIGYLVAFPLIISGVFDDPTQVLAIVSALFGTIVGLVGTYFGVKASSDATRGAQDQANKATTHAVQVALGAGGQDGGGQGAGGGRG